MIALSVAMSVGGCSSPSIRISLRVGRIDAKVGGAFGVPEPETSIEETLEQLEKAGMNHKDAIVSMFLNAHYQRFTYVQALTACGHTLGSVHHGGFPQVGRASLRGESSLLTDLQ
jgi:hypothetical protein